MEGGVPLGKIAHAVQVAKEAPLARAFQTKSLEGTMRRMDERSKERVRAVIIIMISCAALTYYLV